VLVCCCGIETKKLILNRWKEVRNMITIKNALSLLVVDWGFENGTVSRTRNSRTCKCSCPGL
jgi:hypothetical protein